jgi:exodeoxyribonuclease-5
MYGIPILFVGDHGQLPPISSDDFNLMSNPVIKLGEVHRFGQNSALLDLSIMARNGDNIPFKQFDDRVAKVKETDPLVNDFILNHMGDFSNGVCLCGTNNTRVDVNQLIRLNYGVIQDIEDKIPRMGDRVVCLRNNRNLAEPIYNGMLGKITSMSDISNSGGILKEAWNMSISVDDGFVYHGMVNRHHFGELKYTTDGKEFVTLRELMQMKSNLTIKERKLMRGKFGGRRLYFDSFDFGYCLTVHKAQGSEWGNVMLFEESSGYWDEDYRSKWLYTAVTRSNNRLLIIG